MLLPMPYNLALTLIGGATLEMGEIDVVAIGMSADKPSSDDLTLQNEVADYPALSVVQDGKLLVHTAMEYGMQQLGVHEIGLYRNGQLLATINKPLSRFNNQPVLLMNHHRVYLVDIEVDLASNRVTMRADERDDLTYELALNMIGISSVMPNKIGIANGGTGASNIAGIFKNLGLGSAATKNYGVDAGELVQLGPGGMLPEDLLLKNGLTLGQLNANNKVYHPKHYGPLTNGQSSDTATFQRCADALPNGGVFRFDGLAKLTRAVGKHEDIYGTEGRTYKNALTLNGGQPCIIFREKKDIVIDLRGCELFTEVHSQGIIDLYKCENVTIIGGKITGGSYVRSTGEYKWIPIDGNTGRGEKGYPTAGFNTTSLTPDIGTSRNNQFITQGLSAGGYGGNFPQFDGTTAKTWGTWRGGQIGSQGYAICIIGGRNIEITRVESHGFNGGSVIMGIQRTLDGERSFERISTPETRDYSPKQVDIHHNYFHDNYIGAAHLERGLHIKFHDNLVVNMGHPDSSVAHDYVDPGYGFSTSRAMPCFDYDVKDNYFFNCWRKGIDTHQGSGFELSGNKIWGTKWHAIGIAIDDDFADPYYQPYFDHFAIVRDNEILANNCGIYYANGAFGRTRREDIKKRWEQLHVIIDGNLVRAQTCFYFNYAHAPLKLINNTFVFASPYAYQKVATGLLSAVYIGSLARGLVAGDLISSNTFRNSKDGNFAYFISLESGSNQTKGTIITNNTFDVTPWYYVAGADSMYAHNDLTFRSSYTTNPILYSSQRMVPDAIIDKNTLVNDFLHPIVFGGGGTGAVAYPKIDSDGRVSGVQLLSGGNGYTGSVTATITNKGRSSGCTLAATATNGVITSVTVTSPGRFYSNTHTYSVPSGQTVYDMTVVSGTIAADVGSNKTGGNGCDLMVTTSDLSTPVNPFQVSGNIRSLKTIAKNGSVPAQFAIYNGGLLGGTIAFWFKVDSGQAPSRVRLHSLFGSFDGVNNATGSSEIDILADGFTFTAAPTALDGVAYVAGTKLSFDTWYHVIVSNSVHNGSCIAFGANDNKATTSVSASFANIMIHRGRTYISANELLDLFAETKSIFGK